MTIAPIRKEVQVPQDPARAFDLFTRKIGMWWPHGIRLNSDKAGDMLLEPGVGGRWLRRSSDGVESLWGNVLVWEPPERVILAWRVGEAWKYDCDVQTELEISFEPSERGCSVRMEHRHLERIGKDAAHIAAQLAAGWTLVFDALAAYAEGELTSP